MKVPAKEFSRPLPVDRIPPGGGDEAIEAEPAECEALSARLGLAKVYAVSARLAVDPWRGGGVKVEGHLTADVEQRSVVSLALFRQTLEFPVLRYFLPAGALAEDDSDADAIEAGLIDLGEIVAETMALELDPYPKLPGETFESEEEPSASASPFAALARLKAKD